jgi:hypothetical protein
MKAELPKDGCLVEGCRRSTVKQLLIRCGKAQTNVATCDARLLELYLSIYLSIEKIFPKYQNSKLDNKFTPLLKFFKSNKNYTKTTFYISEGEFEKLQIILGLLQDEFLPWTQKTANYAYVLLQAVEEINKLI